MSHFSTIKTKIKDKDILIKALNALNYSSQENVLLDNPIDHLHEKVKVEVGLTRYVGFKRQTDGTLNLVAELDAWEESIPVERFLQKVTQEYAKCIVVETAQSNGFNVTTEQKDVDNTIEIVMEKW